MALLDIKLSEKGQQLLFSNRIASTTAQTALAKGITAQKRGTVVEAMSYYYDAARYYPSLTEATNRLSLVSTTVKTGNIGADARNIIEKREAWSSMLDQCGEYFSHHLPIEIEYRSALKQTNLNYQNKTVDLELSISSYQSENVKIINNILSGLKKTKKKEEWGWEYWPVFYSPYADDKELRYGRISIDNLRGRIYGVKKTTVLVALINDENRVISQSIVTLNNEICFSGKLFINPLDIAIALPSVFMLLAVQYLDDNIYNVHIKPSKGKVTFRGVSAYAITDNLTVKIISVNGISAEDAAKNGYVRIITKK